MSNKKEMVGMDRRYCPCYPGDTIIDANGVKYTISERGTCVDAAGKDHAFSDLHGPELCSVEVKQPAPVEDPAPKERLLQNNRRGGKENKSGLVSLSNLARKLHTKQAGIARTLRAGGIDVVKGKNCYGIRVADIEKAEQLLAPLKRALPSAKKAPAVRVAVAIDSKRFEEQAEQIKEDLDNWELNRFTDQQLADALRYRGYEVTATKTVVVSL